MQVHAIAMKVAIYTDELYPMFKIFRDNDIGDSVWCDVPDGLLMKYDYIMADFEDMQRKLEHYLCEANANKAKSMLSRYVKQLDVGSIATKHDPIEIMQKISEFEAIAEDTCNRSFDGVRPSEADIASAKEMMVRGKILDWGR